MELAHTDGVWAANQPVVASKVEYVADVYAEILKAEETGTVQVIRYNSLPNEKKQEYVDMMKTMILKQGYLTSDSKKALFFKGNFLESWKAAENAKYPHIIVIHGAPGSGILCTGIKPMPVRSCRLLQTGNLEFELRKFPVRSIKLRPPHYCIKSCAPRGLSLVGYRSFAI